MASSLGLSMISALRLNKEAVMNGSANTKLPKADKKGSLTVVGSGIKSIGHITLETQGWIREADIVVYCVADPATEIWIKNNSKECFDLYTLYGNTKKRIDTYNDMVDVMVKHTRAGKNTCAVFYGHPGVFVLPSHKAIKILREEGYRATMLPAISALDCLYADLGIDPSTHGSQEFEATDLLLRKRQLHNDMHSVVWQIGCVGDLGFKFSGYDNRNLNVLVDYLETFYLPTHQVVHYQGSQYPMCEPSIEKIALENLKKAKVTGISTLYIPPQEKSVTDPQMLALLGLAPKPATAATPAACQPAAAAAMEYMPSPSRSGLAQFIADVAETPSLLLAFQTNPKATLRLCAKMTAPEEKAILAKHPGMIRMAMKNLKDYPHLEHIYLAHNPKPK
jgi:precorrin-6B methylase 1